MPVTIRQIPDGVLLQEASALVGSVLGAKQRFASRAQFFQWFKGGGQASLVAKKAMKPLPVVTPDTALEYTVGLLRLYGTRRPPEAYERLDVEPFIKLSKAELIRKFKAHLKRASRKDS